MLNAAAMLSIFTAGLAVALNHLFISMLLAFLAGIVAGNVARRAHNNES